MKLHSSRVSNLNMKKEGFDYLLVGIFVLGMFVAMLVLLFRVTGRDADTDAYYVRYDNITGVGVGTLVTYGGYQVGQVEGITPERSEHKTRYRLRLGLRSGWQIPADSVARVVSPGLLSDNQIDIVEGDSATLLKPGDALRGQELVSMMSLLDSMAYELKDLSDSSIKPLLEHLDRQVRTFGDELNASVPRLTAQAQALLQNLNTSAEGLQTLFGAGNQRRVSKVLDNAERLSANLASLSEQFGAVRNELDQLLKNSNAMMAENRADIRATVLDLRSSLDTVSRNIDTIVYNLESSSRNMNEFSRQIRRNPGLLLTNQPPDEPAAGRP